MAKFTFTITHCKVQKVYTPFVNTGNGKIIWEDGGIAFEKSFECEKSEVVEILKQNKFLDVQFKAVGYLFKKEGFGDYAGRMLEKLMVTKLEVVK